jgi:hypothetical protein
VGPAAGRVIVGGAGHDPSVTSCPGPRRG